MRVRVRARVKLTLTLVRSTLAHSLHMLMCRQGRTVVSRGSVMQMTHSL